MKTKKHSFLSSQLRLIPSKEQFDLLICDDPKQISNSKQAKKMSISSNHTSPIFHVDSHNQDIVIPRCGKISNPQQFKCIHTKFRPDIQKMGYMRLKLQHNLPNPFIYELTEQDRTVFNYIKQKYIFPKETNFQLQQRHLALIFKLSEDFTYSRHTQFLNLLNEEILMSDHIASHLGHQFAQNQRQMLSEVICTLFRYWKIVKKDYSNQPLIRKYWPKGSIQSPQKNAWIPFKTRFPGILDPKLIKKELKLLSGQKMPLQNQELKIISNINEWKTLYEVHRQKKKHFQSEMKNFHIFAAKYGLKHPSFIQSNSKVKENLDKQLLQQDEGANQSNQPPKAPLFRTINEWIQNEKKKLNMQQLTEDQDKDLQIVDGEEFNELILEKVEKNLSEQKEAFRINVKEEDGLSQEVDSMLGSENFYQDLDWDIEEPQNWLVKCNPVKKAYHKCRNNSTSESYTSDTTFYEDSGELEYKKAHPGNRRREKVVSKSTKKVKRI